MPLVDDPEIRNWTKVHAETFGSTDKPRLAP